MTTDGDLVRQARAGDAAGVAAAYGHLARRWAARVLAVCHARTGSADAAEDLAQEALLRGLRSLPSLADPEKFGPWLVGIAVRTCLDWLKNPRRSEVSLDALAKGPSDAVDDAVPAYDLPSAVDADAAEDARDRAERLTREVERLPRPYREVLMLYYYQSAGSTYRELADLLGVSPATVNARLTKARQMLRERMMAEREG
jgi:RNA polymerase sigma factor (sigma-70 family)